MHTELGIQYPSTREAQALDFRARELAGEAFDNVVSAVCDYLADAQTGDGSTRAFYATRDILRAAVGYCALPTQEGLESLRQAVESLRDEYINQKSGKYEEQAWDEWRAE